MLDNINFLDRDQQAERFHQNIFLIEKRPQAKSSKINDFSWRLYLPEAKYLRKS